MAGGGQYGGGRVAAGVGGGGVDTKKPGDAVLCSQCTSMCALVVCHAVGVLPRAAPTCCSAAERTSTSTSCPPATPSSWIVARQSSKGAEQFSRSAGARTLLAL